MTLLCLLMGILLLLSNISPSIQAKSDDIKAKKWILESNYVHLGDLCYKHGKFHRYDDRTVTIRPTRSNAIFETANLPIECTRHHNFKNTVVFVTHGAPNIFHVIFDDLIPIFRNAEQLLPTEQLVLMIPKEDPRYKCLKPLYELLTSSMNSTALLHRDTPLDLFFPNVTYVKFTADKFNIHLLQANSSTPRYRISPSQPHLKSSQYLSFASFVKRRIIKSNRYCFPKVPKFQVEFLNDAHQCKIALISRNRASRRKILNEVDLEELLLKFPSVQLSILHLENYSIEDQISLVHDQNMLIGMHGAGLSHFLWMESQSLVVEIFPPGIEKLTIYDLTRKLDIHHAAWYAPINDKKSISQMTIQQRRDQNMKIEIDETFIHFIEQCIALTCH